MDDLTTWNKQLALAMRLEKDDGPIVAKAPSDEATWDKEFDNGFGGVNGTPVLAWTEKNVYFPVMYDGSEWLDSAPRNPRAEGQGHVGNG